MKLIDLLDMLHELECCNVRVIVEYLNDCSFYDLFGLAFTVRSKVIELDLIDCIVCEFKKTKDRVFVRCVK